MCLRLILCFGIGLLVVTTQHPIVAFAQSRAADGTPSAASSSQIDVLPESNRPQSTWRSWLSNPDIIAEGTGALIGFIAFNAYVAPIAAAAGPSATGLQSWLGTRVVASTLAATGAVLTTTAYDIWADRPLNYSIFWGRAGAVAGVAAGSALLGLLGYPSSATLTRFSPAWVANRSFLVGMALLGNWAANSWANSRQVNQAP